MVTNRNFLIWSKEHNAWWKRGRLGYTTDVGEAGAYSQDQAVEICKAANIHWDGIGQPEEIMVPVQMILSTQSGEPRTRRTIRYGRTFERFIER